MPGKRNQEHVPIYHITGEYYIVYSKCEQEMGQWEIRLKATDWTLPITKYRYECKDNGELLSNFFPQYRVNLPADLDKHH